MNQANVRSQFTSRFEGAPVTKYLMLSNILFFLVDVAGVGEQAFGRLEPFLAFTVQHTFLDLQLWRLIGFQFLHADLGHLFFNMFAIYMFGAIVERFMGARRFIAYYLLCGVAGALLYSLLAFIGWLQYGILVGASAGIFGIIVALIIMAPDMRVMLLFPPIPMKLKTFGMVILGLGVVTVLFNGNNAGGEAGHLGGALFGFILMRNPRLLDWVDRIGKPRGPKKRKAQRLYEPKIRPRTSMREVAGEVDQILDKVSEHGIHSLTDEERQKLLEVSHKNKS